jgi:hypothetical protein
MCILWVRAKFSIKNLKWRFERKILRQIWRPIREIDSWGIRYSDEVHRLNDEPCRCYVEGATLVRTNCVWIVNAYHGRRYTTQSAVKDL